MTRTKISTNAQDFENLDSRLHAYFFGGKSVYDNIKKTYRYCKGVIELHLLNDGCAVVEYANTGKQTYYVNASEAFSDAKAAGSNAWRVERCFR